MTAALTRRSPDSSSRSATRGSTGNTEQAIVAQLTRDGVDALDARIAAAAVLAALVAGLFAWAGDDSTSLAASIEHALDIVDPGEPGVPHHG